MKKCPKCNAEFAWGVKSCPSCGKKVKNPKVTLHLKNANGQECTVSCREEIKQNWMNFRLVGIPALLVKPVEKKDVIIKAALLALIFLLPSIFENTFGDLMCIAMFVVNIIYELKFYFNAIKKKLNEGYAPADDDTAAILANAGLTGNAGNAGEQKTTTTTNAGPVFCSKCGAKIDDGSKFCQSCGTPVPQQAAPVFNAANAAASFAENAKAAINSSGLKKHLTKRNIIIAAVAIVLICIVANVAGGGNAVKIVKNGSFYFSPDITVGELIEDTFDNVEWEEITATDGKPYVNVTIREGKDKMIIQFSVNKNKRTFYVYACEINGFPISVEDLF